MQMPGGPLGEMKHLPGNFFSLSRAPGPNICRTLPVCKPSLGISVKIKKFTQLQIVARTKKSPTTQKHSRWRRSTCGNIPRYCSKTHFYAIQRYGSAVSVYPSYPPYFKDFTELQVVPCTKVSLIRPKHREWRRYTYSDIEE